MKDSFEKKEWMMRRILISIIITILICGCVSPFIGLEKHLEEEKTMQLVYEIPGANRETLFDRTVQWIHLTVVSQGGELLYQDRAGGTIAARVMTSYKTMEVPIASRYTTRVDVKDGRIRLTCYDFEELWGEFRKKARPVEDRDFLKQLKENALKTSTALRAYLSGGSPSSGREW